MSFKQIQTKKISEIVREQIEERMRAGKIQPGDKLSSVVQLAEEFQVSRSAVREALSALRAVGAVTIRQGEGTFVNEYDFSGIFDPLKKERVISKQEMLDLFEVRKIIEAGTAELAALKRTGQNLQEIRDALTDMETASEESVGEAADVSFHLAVAASTQNKTMVQMMEQLADTLRRTMFEARRVWLFSEKKSLNRLFEEHMHIYEAIAASDPEAARTAMLAHLSHVETTIIEGSELA
ncbi:FadR/GntR family transcriptional regulator [Alkalicoccus halolimnae]|uniref:FadR/GntR family transcriptional regulator n=1 Tax=Alkalicoccus halolimnae TaxID=1667239 RepID=A0A5C7FEL9_9BACI|nr:FadR/GntR family transcriptional regulator [Alkalicoccus halolimnae]TXF83916.1 FadR family transcriptional regulator [Alkalicoccus halolimnae]